MDRDEALRLLKGGPKGIEEWNRRRDAGEEIPNLSRANLAEADLRGANLEWTHLEGADLFKADLRGVNPIGANFEEADLIRADLRGVDLCGANFHDAKLRWADLRDAISSGVNLYGADLRGADLRGANLEGACLNEATLGGADLRRADLRRADLRRANMVRVDLREAKLRDCRIFGISAWDIKTDKDTEQIDLVISDDEPAITVDNLKVAQFIYLLLNNEEIRDVIDTITSKVVLILGRFTPERKVLLDDIRDALRQRNYLPVMFDFEKPRSRGYTETITTLARMARFIVADLTDATEVRAELAVIVCGLPLVPVQPLLLASQTPYVTFDDIRRYPWVLNTFYYEDAAHVIVSLSELVRIAEEKVTELRKV